MSDEDYKDLMKLSIGSLKELMASEFAAVKASQIEGHRFSQEQVDHVYEVIKILSKKIEESFQRTDGAIGALDSGLKSMSSWQSKIVGAIAVGIFVIPLVVGIILYWLEHR